MNKLKKAIKDFNPSIIFHLAAQSSVLVSYENPLKTVSTNVLGTANVLETIKNTPSLKSAIIVTTDKVYLNLEKKKKLMKIQNSVNMIYIVLVKPHVI